MKRHIDIRPLVATATLALTAWQGVAFAATPGEHDLLLPLYRATVRSGALDAVNSPGADGSLTRGARFMRDSFVRAAVDQFEAALRTSPVRGTAADALWGAAIATLADGKAAQARAMLNEFIELYPASANTLSARIALADCDFFEGKYKEALAFYDSVPQWSPSLDVADDLTYRRAFCCMMLGSTDRAMKEFALLDGNENLGTAARFYQGYLCYTLGYYSKAREMMESVANQGAPGDKAGYYLAQIAFKERDFNKALQLARSNASTSNDDVYSREMLRVEGESLYQLGDKEAGLECIKRYVAETPADAQSPSALYLLGVNAYDNGDDRRAIELLTPATQCNDALGQSAYLYVGQALMREHDLDAALPALEKAYRMDYDRDVTETAMYNYAAARMEGGRVPFGSSVGLMEEFLKRYPQSKFAPQVREYLVTAYMTDNNYEKALASIDAIKNPTPAINAAKQRVLYILGSRDLADNRASEALERFRRSAAVPGAEASMAAETSLWIGDCLYRLGRYKEAQRSINEYLTLAPKSSPNRTVALYDLAYTDFALRQYGKAMGEFQKVVKSTPAPDSRVLADAYNRIGDCHYYATDFSAAATAYDKALSINPSAGDYALFQKALMRGLSGNHTAKIEMLDDMMKRYPTSGMMPSALLEKAESYLALNRQGDAVTTYNTLIKKFPQTAQGRNGYLQLAITHMSSGNSSKAIEVYKKVISTYPTSDEARVASEDLKRILADEGRLGEYTSFISGVPNAPALDISEIDRLTFLSAEKLYLASGETKRLKEYVEQFPSGHSAPQALSYLATSAFKADDLDGALDYATSLVNRFPHSEAAEEALAIKGDVELRKGDAEKALVTFTELAKSASGARNRQAANLGIMRVSRDMGQHDEVIKSADILLASATLSATHRPEIEYARAYALAQIGKTKEAASAWEKLSAHPEELYGAMAAFNLAQQQFDAGQTKTARTTVSKLIDSNTPQQYWLARAYILMSDIIRKQGKSFEADEYLKSLRDNYPGEEADIFQMIDTRLNKQ